jgi:hypothetical protein
LITLKTIFPAIALLLTLTACSELQYYSSTGFAPITSKGYGADYWLEQRHEIRTMTAEQRLVTYELWEQDYIKESDTNNRVKLALLLASGHESIRNLERAREILVGIDPEPENHSDQEFIIVLKHFIDEQLQADASISDLRALSKKKTRQIKELEEQQRALTNIEQNIQQREIPPETGNVDQ